jgi:hypothetical protein
MEFRPAEALVGPETIYERRNWHCRIPGFRYRGSRVADAKRESCALFDLEALKDNCGRASGYVYCRVKSNSYKIDVSSDVDEEEEYRRDVTLAAVNISYWPGIICHNAPTIFWKQYLVSICNLTAFHLSMHFDRHGFTLVDYGKHAHRDNINNLVALVPDASLSTCLLTANRLRTNSTV